jgi:hypothetical protein
MLFTSHGLTSVTNVQSQIDMAEGARKIIAASRTQRKRGEQEQEEAPKGDAVDASGVAAAGTVGEKRGGKGVLPGSFAAQLEAWKSKYEGEKEVSDDLVSVAAARSSLVATGGPPGSCAIRGR